MVVRWGIVGTGGIADAMAKTLVAMPEADLVAVSSRTPGRAPRFADRHGVRGWYQSAEALARSGVDVVYVASTNERHPEDAIAALEAGAAVLCEKPLAVDAGEAARMVVSSIDNSAFLMEAMWMRFLPFWVKLTDLVNNGAIGSLRTITADFGFPADPDPARRFFDRGKGGGALLDVGIYPLTLACLLAGEPLRVAAVGVPAKTGVDAQVGMTLEHAGGVISVLGASFVSDLGGVASISGSRGRIHLRAPFHHATTLELWRIGDLVESFDVGFAGSGYRFEVEEVHRSIHAGRLESAVHPLDHSLMIMRVMDQVRAVALHR
jgi:predicted dehydrogenase